MSGVRRTSSFRVSERSQARVQEIFNRLIAEAKEGTNAEIVEKIPNAFNDEAVTPEKLIALGLEHRTYFIVEVEGREEALFGMNFYHGRTPAPISYTMSSLARIVPNRGAAPGWKYLDAMIKFLIPKCRQEGVWKINAHLMTTGAVKAFNGLHGHLQRRQEEYTVTIPSPDGALIDIHTPKA